MSGHRQKHLNDLERSHRSLLIAEERASIPGEQFYVDFFTKCVVHERQAWMRAVGLLAEARA
jgi:hypothetical protein